MNGKQSVSPLDVNYLARKMGGWVVRCRVWMNYTIWRTPTCEPCSRLINMQPFLLTRIVRIYIAQLENYLRCITYTPGVTKQKPSKRANCKRMMLCTPICVDGSGSWPVAVGSFFPVLIMMSPGHLDIVWGDGANSILMLSANVVLWKFVIVDTPFLEGIAHNRVHMILIILAAILS